MDPLTCTDGPGAGGRASAPALVAATAVLTDRAQRVASRTDEMVAGLPTEVAMGKIQDIERQVQALSPEELAQFRAWFLEFDWATWDHQIERDVQAGRLDALAEKALRDHAAGKTTPL